VHAPLWESAQGNRPTPRPPTLVTFLASPATRQLSDRSQATQSLYEAYKDKKRQIRDHAATDIQKCVRGFLQRARSLRGAERPVITYSGGAFRKVGAKTFPSSRRDDRVNKLLSLSNETEGEGDRGGGYVGQGDSASGVTGRRALQMSVPMDMDSRPASAGAQGSLALPDNQGLPTRGGVRGSGGSISSVEKDQAPVSSLLSADVGLDSIPAAINEALLSYRHLLNQKKELKRRLKQFDEEFVAKHGQPPKKADKEVCQGRRRRLWAGCGWSCAYSQEN